MSPKILHKRSSVTTDGTAKLPTASQLDYGELAINYANGSETITIKNSANEIISFKSQEYIDDNDLFTKGTETNSITRKGTAAGIASGQSAFAAGTNVTASGVSSFAEGQYSTASGAYSHAEGYATKATKQSSHAEGESTEASGNYSHAEGVHTKATGIGSHAEGYYTQTKGTTGAHVHGRANVASYNSIHSIGIGSVDSSANISRKNAEDIFFNGEDQTDSRNGRKYLIGLGNYDGTNLDKDGALNTNIYSVQEIINKLKEKAGGLTTLMK